MKGVGKVAMVGPGAVGGYYGSRLALAGQEIHFLFRSSYHDILREGLWLVHHEEKRRKEKVESLHAHCHAHEIGPCDWVVVASKTTANQDLAEIIAPLIGNETRLLTLQNGMGNVENLADCFGAERTILAGLCFRRGLPEHIPTRHSFQLRREFICSTQAGVACVRQGLFCHPRRSWESRLLSCSCQWPDHVAQGQGARFLLFPD